VRRRRQPDQHQPRPRIAEAGNGAAPVLLVAERGAPLPGHALPPLDEARAEAAADDLLAESFERVAEAFIAHRTEGTM
jgi:hypothetical protein